MHLVKVLTVLAVIIIASVFAQAHAQQLTPAAPEVVARVSLATQTMTVYVDDTLMYSWPVSTARRGYETPPGRYVPYWLDRNHHSHLYNNAPMPYSVFFLGNYAVHGTKETRYLGRRASHGCVRLLIENAHIFYTLVEQYGEQNTKIIIES